jgi:hypothetical protein
MDRDQDVYRIIGQLEANIQSILSNDKDCRIRRDSEQEKILVAIDAFKQEIANRFNTKYDQKDGEAVEGEITSIKGVLNLDNSANVKRNVGFLNSMLNSGVFWYSVVTIIGVLVLSVSRITPWLK